MAIREGAIDLAAGVVEWAEHGSHPVLFASGVGSRARAIAHFARALESRGFCVVDAIDLNVRPELAQSLRHRSVIVLGDAAANSCEALSLALLGCGRFARTKALAIAECSLDGSLRLSSRCESSEPRHQEMPRAAERQPVYGTATSRVTESEIPPDPRVRALVDEAHRARAAGRHAAAERALRAAVSALDRRGDKRRAAGANVELGQLLLARGRSREAATHCAAAQRAYESLRAVRDAIAASLWTGLALTDDAQFGDAEQTLRAAYAAATIEKDETLVVRSAMGLARVLFWLRRHREAAACLEPLREIECPRLWALAAHVELALGNHDRAVNAARRSRSAVCVDPRPASDALSRIALAAVQARVGDLDALTLHARAALASARAARLPLLGMEARLVLAEGFLEAGERARANAVMRRIIGSRRALPPLLQRRVDALRESAERARTAPRYPMVREAALPYDAFVASEIAELLGACHAEEEDGAALADLCAILKKHLRAASVAVFRTDRKGSEVIAASGTIAPAVAIRCRDARQAIPPENGATGCEAAAPIAAGAPAAAVLACRWPSGEPHDSVRALGLMRIAAAACASRVQLLLQRADGTDMQMNAAAGEIIGDSAAIRDVRRLIARAASAPFVVLIEGESGVGKELVARAIHHTGCRRQHPFRALNCAALTEELVDAELFGHAKGAFTGAVTDRQGLFESAGAGTVFLDEVGELSLRAQAKLLRVLQENEVRRVGENVARKVDARLVAATNKPLADHAAAGRFRQDLLYRLDVIRIPVPPLRDRIEDIPRLAAKFWTDAAGRVGSRAVLGTGVTSALARYHWPGNVRELQNVLAAMSVAVPATGVVPASALPAAIANAAMTPSRETLDQARRRFEERFVKAALAQSAGHRGKAATALGVSRQGLAKLMQRLQLS